jgi:HEAT repeat protein
VPFRLNGVESDAQRHAYCEKERTETLVNLLCEKQLSAEDERALVAVLAERLDGKDYQFINMGLRTRLARSPHALDGALPQIATAIRHATHGGPTYSSAEERICYLLDTVRLLDRIPSPLAEAIDEVVMDQSALQFAKPMAASVLLKTPSCNKRMLTWLETGLESDDEYTRYRAAWALGMAGSLTQTSREHLERKLRDPSWTVRVLAAEAIALTDAHPNPAVLSVLQDSLDQPDVGVLLKPADAKMSSYPVSRNCFAIGGLDRLGRAAHGAAPKVVTFLHSKRSILAMCAAHALGELGNESSEVIKALRTCSQDHTDETLSLACQSAMAKLDRAASQQEPRK